MNARWQHEGVYYNEDYRFSGRYWSNAGSWWYRLCDDESSVQGASREECIKAIEAYGKRKLLADRRLDKRSP